MDANIVLQYIKVFLSWPFITLLIVLVFKDAISNFLNRLVKGKGPGGWQFEAATPSEQRKEIKDTPQPQSENEIEKYVKENPKDVIKEYQKAINTIWFERAYNIIYGTQMALLEYLATKGTKGEKYINLTMFYNDFLKRSKFINTQIADYLGFLKDALFIDYIGSDNDITVRITPYGVNFLSYIKLQYPVAYKYKIF